MTPDKGFTAGSLCAKRDLAGINAWALTFVVGQAAFLIGTCLERVLRPQATVDALRSSTRLSAGLCFGLGFEFIATGSSLTIIPWLYL